jgi:hypothetical protein
MEQSYIKQWKMFLTEQEDGTNAVSVNPNVANYPKLTGPVNRIGHWSKAAGDPINEKSGFFPEAAADIRKLRDMLLDQGWKKAPNTNSSYGNFDSWQSSIGFPWNLNEFQKQFWDENVVPNAIELTMTSPQADSSIYVSVWESYDAWLESSEPGIVIHVCAGVQFKGCATKPVNFNRTNNKDSEQLTQEISSKIQR